MRSVNVHYGKWAGLNSERCTVGDTLKRVAERYEDAVKKALPQSSRVSVLDIGSCSIDYPRQYLGFFKGLAQESRLELAVASVNAKTSISTQAANEVRSIFKDVNYHAFGCFPLTDHDNVFSLKSIYDFEQFDFVTSFSPNVHNGSLLQYKEAVREMLSDRGVLIVVPNNASERSIIRETLLKAGYGLLNPELDEVVAVKITMSKKPMRNIEDAMREYMGRDSRG